MQYLFHVAIRHQVSTLLDDFFLNTILSNKIFKTKL